VLVSDQRSLVVKIHSINMINPVFCTTTLERTNVLLPKRTQLAVHQCVGNPSGGRATRAASRALRDTPQRVIHYIAKVAPRRAMEKSSSACGIVRRMGSLVVVWCIHLITLRSARWPRLPA